MREINELYDYDCADVTTGVGAFAAAVPTTLVAPDMGYTWMHIVFRQTTWPIGGVARGTITQAGTSGILRFGFLYVANVWVRIRPDAVASIAVACGVAYDVVASVSRNDAFKLVEVA